MKPLSHEARPAPSPGLGRAELEGGALLLDGRAGTVHLLNSTARAIFLLCDGRRSVWAIQEQLHAVLGEACPDPAFVFTWLERALEAGYLVLEHRYGAPPATLGAGDLRAVAQRLRRAGRTELALAVQRRLLQLPPERAADWLELGELAHIEGQRLLAREAYERYSELGPDDPEVAHILVALRDEEPPDRASDEAIRHLYERFAETYDHDMGVDLGYAAPGLLAEALEPLLGPPAGSLDVLDLGCGTGLSGARFRPWARRLVGVDLSPHMSQRARERGIYDEVETAEITAWLDAGDETFDLVLACDVLIYFGDLAPVFEGVAGRLRPKGRLAFTVEALGRSGWALTDSGRYAHSATCLLELARDCGLAAQHLDEVVLRQEYGEDVGGLRVVLEAAGGPLSPLPGTGRAP